MTSWSDLTPIQAASIRSTAAIHLRDPEAVLAELGPLVAAPYSELAEPSWSLVPTTESAYALSYPFAASSPSAVNSALTDLIYEGLPR